MRTEALLIVDVQSGLFSTPRHDADAIIARLSVLGDRFRMSGRPVFYIQHTTLVEQGLHPSQPGHALHPDLGARAIDQRIEKEFCDAFLNTDLADRLSGSGVTELVIGGFATEYCVDTTIRSALARGFKVTALADGHTTAERETVTAAQIIALHNETWTWLVTPMGAAKLLNCEAVV